MSDTTNQYRSLQDLEERKRSIRGELATIDEIQEPTEEDLNFQSTLIAEYDELDDGWGPPGTTIPPPLLGAMPGTDEDRRPSGVIPIPSEDSAPLMAALIFLDALSVFQFFGHFCA